MGSSLIRHGIRSIIPFHRLLEQDAEHGKNVVHRLWRLDLELRFQSLDVLALDRVEVSATERRDQVQPKDHGLRCNPARLLSIRPARGRRRSVARILVGWAPPCVVDSWDGERSLSNNTRSRAAAHRPTAERDDIGACLRSRLCRVPSGETTRMSTSQPPPRYGRIVTLITSEGIMRTHYAYDWLSAPIAGDSLNASGRRPEDLVLLDLPKAVRSRQTTVDRKPFVGVPEVRQVESTEAG